MSQLILVVDDEASLRRAFETINDAGILYRDLSLGNVLVVPGPEGLELARQHRPDVILLDVLMPGVDGWSVLSALKEDAVLGEIPVVMVSMLDDRQLGFSLGATDYVTKPVDPDELSHTVRRALERKQLTEENARLRDKVTQLSTASG